jgi:hypothetical protein
MRYFIFALAMLVAGVANAQTLFSVKVSDDLTVYAMVTPSGTYTATSITEIDITPTPTVEWQTDKPRVIIVDDENLRGNLPQEQVNIFTSPILRTWMEADGFEYRFSSNDSFIEGGEARKLEDPVWVEGWDLLLNEVKEGTVKLPAWIIGDKNNTVIEELPLATSKAMERLEAFK